MVLTMLDKEWDRKSRILNNQHSKRGKKVTKVMNKKA